jgi:hypothetical protein
MKIFNILTDLCQQQPNFIDPFIQIIQNCIKPFLLDKSTDAEIYSSALTAFYSDFGTENSPLSSFNSKSI